MTPAERKAALELEFDRLKARQDNLDRMLQGREDTWAEIRLMIPDGVELVIDKLVTEARQGATAMASIAKALASLSGDDSVKEAPADPLAALTKVRDEVAAKRAAKAQ